MGKKLVTLIPIIMIFLALFVTGCGDPRDQEPSRPMGHGSYGDIRGYGFDPKTILAALDRNDGEIFQPLPDWGLQEAVFPPGSFAWQQQDYLQIAVALNRVASQDSLEDWSVYGMYAHTECANTPIGFDIFSITYFKLVGNRYATRQIDILPLAKEADWAGGADFPRPFPFGWKSVNLEKLKVTANDVLQQSEANGGKAARLAANNVCSITITLRPNTDGDSWQVHYYSTTFQFSVYPY